MHHPSSGHAAGPVLAAPARPERRRQEHDRRGRSTPIGTSRPGHRGRIGGLTAVALALVVAMVGPGGALAQELPGAPTTPTTATTVAPPAGADATASTDTTAVAAPQQQAKAGPGDIVVSQFHEGTASVITTGEQVSTLVEGLATPTGIVALESGTVLFAENTGNRISAVGGPYGTTVTAVVPQVSGPYALGLSEDGAVYVTQLIEGKVSQVDMRGGKLEPIGEGLSRPTAVTGFNKEIYVAEAGTGKVVKFGTDRKQVDVATDLGQPNGIAIAPDGTIYVSDFQNGRIVKIAPNGEKSDFVSVDGPRQLALDPAAPKNGEDYQVIAGTSQGIVQYDKDGKVVATVPFSDQAVGGVGVVPGGPPPNVTPTAPVGTPPTLRATTTVASSGLVAPPASTSSNAGPILIGLLIALLILAAVAFVIYRYTKQRGKRTEEEAGFTDLREMSVTMTQAMGPCAAQEVELAEAEDTLHQVVGQRLGAEGRLADAETRSETARERESASRATAERLRDERRRANGGEEVAPPPPLSLAELGLTTEAGRAALQAFGRGELDAVKLRERWDELGESSAVAAVQGHSEKIARTTPWPEERQASLAAEQAHREYELADDDARDARADIERMREREAQLQERIDVARVAVDDCHKRQKLADEEAAAAAASALADIQITSDLAKARSGDDGGGAPDADPDAEQDADPEPEAAPVGATADDATDERDETGKIPRPSGPPPTVEELIDLSRQDEPDDVAENDDADRDDADDADADPVDVGGGGDRRRRRPWRR
jgi:hypothetical protein